MLGYWPDEAPATTPRPPEDSRLPVMTGDNRWHGICIHTAEVADHKRSILSIPVAPTSQDPRGPGDSMFAGASVTRWSPSGDQSAIGPDCPKYACPADTPPTPAAANRRLTVYHSRRSRCGVVAEVIGAWARLESSESMTQTAVRISPETKAAPAINVLRTVLTPRVELLTLLHR